jgi:hypothetical protein
VWGCITIRASWSSDSSIMCERRTYVLPAKPRRVVRLRLKRAVGLRRNDIFDM